MSKSGINSAAYDERDKEILKRLAAEHKCQKRLITDGGMHYIFCGASYNRPPTLVGNKWLCKLCERRQ